MDKYYYIKYCWRSKNSGDKWEHSSTVSNIHPMLCIKEWYNNYHCTEYVVEFYEEITEELFNELEGIM